MVLDPPPATRATGSLHLAYPGGINGRSILMTSADVVKQQHAGAFRVVGFSAPLELKDSGASATLDIQFDATGTGLAGGDTSTGVVELVWNKEGDAANYTNAVMVSVYVLESFAVTKETDPKDSDVLCSNVVAAVNWGTPVDGDGDGNVVGVATEVTINGTAFSTIDAIGDQSRGYSAADVDETYGDEQIGRLRVTASHVDGYSDFDGRGLHMGGNIENIFSSIGVGINDDFNFAFTGLQEGATYQLQLFFSSGGQGRILEVYRAGDPDPVASWNNATDRDTLITLDWVADASGTESFSFVNTSMDEILSGFVFAATATPSPPLIRMENAFGGNPGLSVGGLTPSRSYALQGKETLLDDAWSRIATTSGVTRATWDHLVYTNRSMFFRIIEITP